MLFLRGIRQKQDKVAYNVKNKNTQIRATYRKAYA